MSLVFICVALVVAYRPGGHGQVTYGWHRPKTTASVHVILSADWPQVSCLALALSVPARHVKLWGKLVNGSGSSLTPTWDKYQSQLQPIQVPYLFHDVLLLTEMLATYIFIDIVCINSMLPLTILSQFSYLHGIPWVSRCMKTVRTSMGPCIFPLLLNRIHGVLHGNYCISS